MDCVSQFDIDGILQFIDSLQGAWDMAPPEQEHFLSRFEVRSFGYPSIEIMSSPLSSQNTSVCVHLYLHFVSLWHLW